MNEILFMVQSLLVFAAAFCALRLGKEALFAWISLQALLANVFVLKQVELFGLSVTASDVYTIGSILGLNLLQEYFGKESANQATSLTFFAMIFCGMMSWLHLLFIPSNTDVSQPAFLTILSKTPRLLLASLTTFFIVQRIDVRIFSFLKKELPLASLALRTCISLVLAQLLDTALFSLLGLYGLVSSLWTVFLWSFAIKLLLIFAMTPLLTLFKKKRHV